MTKELFCSRCRKWKKHEWIIDGKIKTLKCTKCKKNKQIEMVRK